MHSKLKSSFSFCVRLYAVHIELVKRFIEWEKYMTHTSRIDRVCVCVSVCMLFLGH